MLMMRRRLGGMLVVLLVVTATGCSSPSKSTRVPVAVEAVTSSKTGIIVINPQFDLANSFSDGLAAVRIGDVLTGEWGFVDKTGRIVINPQFDWAGSFSDGLAAVRIGDFETGKVDVVPTAYQVRKRL